MQLHRNLLITQKSAWFMLHKLRKAVSGVSIFDDFSRIVEVDETYVRGFQKNVPVDKKLNSRRGGVGKATIVCTKTMKQPYQKLPRNNLTEWQHQNAGLIVRSLTSKPKTPHRPHKTTKTDSL